MTRRLLLATGLLLFFVQSGHTDPPALPAFPPLNFHAPKPERMVLPNGMVLYLMEDHELPLIKLQLVVKAGSQYDPPDQVGLSALLGPVMTQGGSLHHTPEDIQKLLDTTAGSISFGVSLEEGDGNLECRSSDFQTLFPVFADLLMHPQFRNDFFKIEKNKAYDELRRMNDDPEEISRREFRQVLYGTDHPYARIADPATLDHIKRKDLIAYHARYFKPNTIIMAISGDFKSEDMKALFNRTFAGWAKADVTYPPVPPVIPTVGRKVYYVERPISQSQIRIGQTGFARHNPDHFAWEVFNELWGGSGTSLLFRTIRTQQGLAYAVGSAFTEPSDLGIIAAICQTRGAETIQAIQSLLDITQAAQKAPFTESEIHVAKDAIRNRFINDHFTSSAQISGEFSHLEYDHYPADYLDTYISHVNDITKADLQRVAITYLHPDQSLILVVGDLSTFNKPLSIFGPLQQIQLPDYSQLQ